MPIAGLISTSGALHGKRSTIPLRDQSAAQRREAAILLATGLAVGTALSLVSTQAAASLLFGLKPRAPLTLALAAFTLALIAAAASYLPAFRAARIHPTEALREE